MFDNPHQDYPYMLIIISARIPQSHRDDAERRK